MRLHLLKVCIVWAVARKVLIARKRIEIRKHGIALEVPGIAHLQMQRVGVHTHNLGAHLICAVRKIDTVAKGLAHLCLSVCARQPLARLHLWHQRFWLYKHRIFRRIDSIKFVYDLLGLLDHGKLILPHWHHIRLTESDICRLTDRISKKPYGNARLEVPKLYLTLYCRIAL